MTFFYKNAINVFTDASITKKNDVYITAPGFVTMYDGNIIDSGVSVIHNATNNYGEIYAIRMGIENLIKYSNSDLFLNLFSDSKISILGLKQWIFQWFQNQSNNVLRNSYAEAISNQEIILDIIRLIVHSGIHISLYHIPGHIRSNRITEMNKFKEVFSKNTGLHLEGELQSVPDDILREMADCNNTVDNLTRKVLLKTVNHENYNPMNYMKYTKYPFAWFPKIQDIQTYHQLIS